jgi:glutathione S-transferase
MTDSSARPIVVYTFSSAWGAPVPTVSPFGLKLLTWLKMNEVPYELRFEDNPGKGPKGKCPWVEIDGERIGDSQLVIERLAKRGKSLDDALSPQQRAVATATRLMLEEHYHQVWEHQLFIHEGGWKRGLEFFDSIPKLLRSVARNHIRRQLRKQLIARGVGRHDQAQIVQMGKVVLDSMDDLIGDGPYFFGETPTDIDAVVFGFLAVTHWTPVESPLWDHFRKRARLGKYCDRMREQYFA